MGTSVSTRLKMSVNRQLKILLIVTSTGLNAHIVKLLVPVVGLKAHIHLSARGMSFEDVIRQFLEGLEI